MKTFEFACVTPGKCILLIFLYIFLHSPFKSTAQTNFENHYHFGNKFISSNSVLQNSDGSYLIVGCVDSAVINNNNGQSAYVKKIDVSGNVIWTNYYNFANAYNLVFNKIKKTVDGNLVVVGVIDYGFGVSPTFQDVFFAKLDTLGNTVWTKSYGDIGTDIGFDVLELTNGDFLIQSSFGVLVNLNIFNAYQLIRTNSVGDSLWSHHYYPFDGLEQFPFAVVQTNDQGFVSVGMKLNNNAGTNGYIVKTDSLGQELWNHKIDTSFESDAVAAFVSNNNIVVIGNKNIGTAEEPFIAEFDNLGGVNSFNSLNEINVHVSAATKTSDNGYALIGIEFNANNSKVVLIRLDSMGTKIWKKSFNQLSLEFPNAIHLTMDNGFVFTGSSYDSTLLNYHVFVAKTSDTLAVTHINSVDEKNNFVLYPNPTNNTIKLAFEKNQNNTEVTAYNISGAIIYNNALVDTNKLDINASNWEAGIYLIQIQTAKVKYSKKIVIIK